MHAFQEAGYTSFAQVCTVGGTFIVRFYYLGGRSAAVCFGFVRKLGFVDHQAHTGEDNGEYAEFARLCARYYKHGYGYAHQHQCVGKAVTV